MTCEESRLQLPGFHFGEVNLQVRPGVEAHLMGCRSCVGEFVLLKRAIELGEGPRPSVEARHSLREAMATELGLRWRWWERPVAFFVAASSVVLAVWLISP